MTLRARLCLMLLIGLCSACAKAPAPVVEPIIVSPALCARPKKPDLPKLAGIAFLESGQGYVVLKMRDRMMRGYISGLEDALQCYEEQIQSRESAEGS